MANLKQTKNKLSSLNSPGALMMLFDFLSESDCFGKPLKECIDTEEIVNQVSVLAARLKVRYMNEITPVESVKQIDLETSIKEIQTEKKTKKKKKNDTGSCSI